MKIGTDGVLLGAWARLDHQPNSILDIGAGTGIIALMMAQRSIAQLIDGLEIDDSAYEQCVDNFENSNWSDRLFCYHATFEEFVEQMTDSSYDLILSNPPFFKSPKTGENLSSARKKARFTESLSTSDLIKGSSQLLSKKGRFNAIIPYDQVEGFIKIARTENLHLQRHTKIKGNPKSPIKRSLLQFGFEKLPLETNLLIIEIKRHQYTADYINLTKDFYLKM